MEQRNEEWKREQSRIEMIQQVIKAKLEKLQEHMGGLKEGVIELRRDFWKDVTINLDHPDDVIETFTSIKQQAELLAEQERNHRQSYQKVQQLLRLNQSPYFGRIDFQEEGEQGAEQIYIGITSLMDQEDEDFLIFDWRAPISSLYYDHSPGPASYLTPSGEIKGNIELKRQYIIKGSKLKGMFDTGVTIGDQLLQEVLGGTANTQMKSIVATIQREQNHIIRNEKSRYLVVQGVAGSGKTSAALQRAAYLLYRYRHTLTSENIMLFSPNPLFNSYVATVLPELGEDNMVQTTYQQYLISRFGKGFSVEDSYSQIEYTLTAMDEPEYKQRLEGIRFKTSVAYKEWIDDYVAKLSTKGLKFKSFYFRGELLYSSEEIHDLFYSFDTDISIPNRLKLTSEKLLKDLSTFAKIEREKDWVLEEAELLDKEDYLEAFHQTQKQEEDFDDMEQEERFLKKRIVSKHLKSIRRQLKGLQLLNIEALYRIFLLSEHVAGPKDWPEIYEYTIKQIDNRVIPYEDATPYLYLQDQLEGRKANTLIRHLFIDEAQDYSPFQFEFLRQQFPNSKMTILGDMNQAIYAHSIHAPTLLNAELEGEEKIVLTKSYRSTKQIVEFTRKMIAGGELIEPFNRNGEEPTVTEVDNFEALHKGIMDRVETLQKKGHETIAIICKTAVESQQAYEQLNKQIDVRLMKKETNAYEKGTIILPAYLAKGIEFDAVIVYNASEQQYGREMERNLFYTACTRAMHELHLYSLGICSPFISKE
ncbi:RNA polymerase recycling motor HelD [Lederbergia galactosidilytica]|uniref:DNA 3'-5' helicase n=1 Tax=Lederbergia galactosidilytica TaxID=217031 RepID=A0A178A7L7_9BACI|nr:RNA polymerase recycling motor HelD [Lederbergia galactosidilytica]MBP1915200.1 DNA helicase-2/ATP-dependent DNA helicase PcrA [Lederbergia galactosidilytica]OAK75460.1 helicase [Lederbergia galactosidilytica]